MIRKSHLNLSIPIALLLLATAAIAAPSDKQAKDGSAPLQLPITGSAITSETFVGTLSIERFEAGADQVVVAIGIVRGSVEGKGSALVEVTLPVQVGPARKGAAAPNSAAAPQQATCEALHLEIGAVNLLVGLLNQLLGTLTGLVGGLVP